MRSPQTHVFVPVNEVVAKDEFLGMKGAMRDDVLAVHRVAPQLLGIVPNNAGALAMWRVPHLSSQAMSFLPLQARFRRNQRLDRR
ncbi:hypothetical protein [Pseudomonas sp. CGJS7]|uniref:hypothetical protein n=1 Tax=Pseudomonas sp. CGJS7 TaxID=3109348 RepID=UPI003008BA74